MDMLHKRQLETLDGMFGDSPRDVLGIQDYCEPLTLDCLTGRERGGGEERGGRGEGGGREREEEGRGGGGEGGEGGQKEKRGGGREKVKRNERKGRGGLRGREEGEFNFVLHVSGESSTLS